MPKGLVLGLSMVVGSMAIIIYSANLLAQIGRESVLRSHAEATADQWVTYIQEVVPELSEIASGDAPSNRALMFLAHGIDTSSVINYRLYGRNGELHAAGGATMDDEFEPAHSDAGVATVLASKKPLLEMDVTHPGHRPGQVPSADHRSELRQDHRIRATINHHDHAGMDHRAHTKMGNASAEDEDQAHSAYGAPAVPIDPIRSVTAYFHPIFKGKNLVGVLAIELDHGVIAQSFASTFRRLTIGLTLILVLAVGPPLLFAWRKSIQRGRAVQQARHLAFHDPLTHLPNRRYVQEEIDRRLEEALNSSQTMALLSLLMVSSRSTTRLAMPSAMSCCVRPPAG